MFRAYINTMSKYLLNGISYKYIQHSQQRNYSLSTQRRNAVTLGQREGSAASKIIVFYSCVVALHVRCMLVKEVSLSK